MIPPLQIKRRAKSSKQAGFTLLELVMAIGIMTFVLTITYAALSQIIRGKQILDDERDMSMIANAVLTRITREFQRTTESVKLLPPSESPNKEYGKVSLIGEHKSIGTGESGDTIRFMAADAGQYVPDGLNHTGVVMIGYRVEEDPEADPDNKEHTYLLIRDEVPDLRPVKDAYKKRMTFPITDRLVALELRYYDGEEWSEDWDEEKNELPVLLKFTVKLLSPRGKLHTYSTMVSLSGF